jgi:hypothetical protein
MDVKELPLDVAEKILDADCRYSRLMAWLANKMPQAGKAFPSGLLRAALPLPAGAPPQRPQESGRLVVSMNPDRCLVPRHSAPASSSLRRIQQDRDLPGIPPRPSCRSNCLRDRLVAGPEPHGLPPPIGDPPVGGGGASEATIALPATKRCPRHFARGGKPHSLCIYQSLPVSSDLASAVFHDLALCRKAHQLFSIQ